MSNVAMRIRNTRQLRAIHDVLNETDRPVSIEEIHHAAKVREPSLGVATVYRTVKALVEAGTVVSIALPGEGPRFELSGKGHHHHFQCNRCGRVFETKACLGDLRRLVPRRFQITGHEIVLYGRCAECRA
jgi:Fur family ferric uptake transcriptional regulator